VITPLEGLKQYLGEGVEVLYRDESQVEEARQLAGEVDCVIVIAGYDFNDEGEYVSPGGMAEMIDPIISGYRHMGNWFIAALLKLVKPFTGSALKNVARLAPGGDRQSLALKPEQRQLVEAVAGINPNMVVCLVTGSMILIDEWATDVPAVLYSWYAGMEGGTALARILFGEASPSGKLPFTIPSSTDHLPYFSSTDQEITYDLYHGYTLLDKNGLKPAFPFGFGLSYTTFTYGGLHLVCNNKTLQVGVSVCNTGSRDGEEVVQVYVGLPNSKVERQMKLLKGFEKVTIPAGEVREVTILIPLVELRYYDPTARQWLLEPGIYQVMVGPSSDEATMLKQSLEIA
jgi:beta-glucosidase